MKHKRTRITLGVVIFILLLLGGAIYLRATAPPEVARLLPESDGIIYINLRPLRTATHFDLPKVKHSPGYEKFIHATGIVFDRDLNQVAFALQRMPNPHGPNGPVAYSEVFEGHFNDGRLKKYLAGIAESESHYGGHTIYDISNEGRTDRVALLGYDMVAVSNTPTPKQIHSIVNRYRTAALPFSGSSLLRAHYHQIPAMSVAWGIGKIGLPFAGGKAKQISVDGVDLAVSPNATFLASARWTGALRLRLEEIAKSSASAKATMQSLHSLLDLLYAAEKTPPGGKIDPGIRTAINSVKLNRKKNHVVLTASLSDSLLRAMVTPIAAAETKASSSAEPQQTAPSSKAPKEKSKTAKSTPTK